MKLEIPRKITAMAMAFLTFGGVLVSSAQASEYSFRVHNGTDSRITKILVSEDRRSWGQFDIGSGIKPGATVKLVWDKSTNNQACDQYLKAQFADGTEAKSTKFDFCEKDLEVEF